jgi:hypothetical protein
MRTEEIVNEINKELNSKWINSISSERKIVTPNKSISYMPYAIYTYQNGWIKSRLFFESLDEAVKCLENNL